MLVRAYRLSDKLGITLLKLSVAFGQLSLVGISRVTSIGGRTVGGIFAVIFGVIFGILRGILNIVRTIFVFIFSTLR